MDDETFLTWLEQQPDVQMPKSIYLRVLNLLNGTTRKEMLGFNLGLHLPQPPFACAALIRERMVERVVKKLE